MLASDRTAPSPDVEIRWHTAAREELLQLFELAEDSPEELASYLHLGRVLVAVDDGSVVAHLQLVESDTADELELKSLAVLEQHQRRGIGRALVDCAVAECRAGGTHTLLVATGAADVGNLRFYQLLGFRMLRIERDAFTASHGYLDGLVVDGIPLRDRVWLSTAL